MGGEGGGALIDEIWCVFFCTNKILWYLHYLPTSIGACRPEHWLGYFESCVLISREPNVKISYIAYAWLCTHRHTYSIQCSDKMHTLSAIAHQMWHSQVLPGYPHSSAGTYAYQNVGTELLKIDLCCYNQ